MIVRKTPKVKGRVFRITDGASLHDLIKQIENYEPTQQQLDEFEEAMRKGPPTEAEMRNRPWRLI